MNIFKSYGPSGEASTTEQGKARLNEFNFAFTDMGQGDCTVISCPDNSLYIVDCGSSANLPPDAFTALEVLVRKWANGKNVNMIMTHPDKDHYNKFLALVMATPPLRVNTIFFSRAQSDKSPLGHYKETALGRNLHHFGNPMLTEVTLNSTGHRTKKWTLTNNYRDGIEQDIPATGLVLQSGAQWSLTIIAGNVKAGSNSASEISNAVSLCTVATIGTEKVVLTGDANLDTLDFLLSSQPAHIKNASIWQVSHHGSESSTPTAALKKLVNPQHLLVSVGAQSDGFRLPRFSVLDAWASGGRLRDSPNARDYWKTPDEVHSTHDDLKAIPAKWRGYAFTSNASKTFFYLEDPADAGPTKSNTGYYGFTYAGYFLYRVIGGKDIYETGIMGSEEAGFTV